MFQKVKGWLSGNSIFVVSLIVVWLVVIGALLMASQKAHAEETFIGNEDACVGVASDAARMAMARDSGIIWEHAEAGLIAGMNEAKGDADSYIKTDDDVASIYNMAKSIWASHATPERASEIAFHACMAAGATRKQI